MPGLLNRNKLLLLVLAIYTFSSCQRNDIEFGDLPENNYTNLVYTDTVDVKLSTVLMDSFATNGDTSFLIGRYNDPYLGAVSAKAFFQMTVPSAIPDIPSSAKFDSLTFIIRPNKYHYGDTSRTQTIYIHELADEIVYSYNSQLYNTSNIAVKPTPLGTKTVRIYPNITDSVSIRLQDGKGLELYSKLQQSSSDVVNENEFLNYFRGISIAVDNNDTTVVYGLSGTAGSLTMRVHYHTTIPYPEDHHIDFGSLANSYSFNQVLTNRPGTGLVSGTTGRTEIPSGSTNDLSYMQPGTGLYLKMIFPSLKGILSNENIVKLVKAELIIRPTYLSFDKDKYVLPSKLYLTRTDASNTAGSYLLDSAGVSVLYADPFIDNIYGENTHYRLNVTSYINQLLNTSGSSDDGLFVMQNSVVSQANVDRLIVNSAVRNGQHSQLLLSLMIINR
ncbi:MAG: DUF4270 family protein [Chitinophagaceae bacterium]